MKLLKHHDISKKHIFAFSFGSLRAGRQCKQALLDANAWFMIFPFFLPFVSGLILGKKRRKKWAQKDEGADEDEEEVFDEQDK